MSRLGNSLQPRSGATSNLFGASLQFFADQLLRFARCSGFVWKWLRLRWSVGPDPTEAHRREVEDFRRQSPQGVIAGPKGRTGRGPYGAERTGGRLSGIRTDPLPS